MADPVAVTSPLSIRIAECPTCGESRTYYLDGNGKPIPFDVNQNELDEARILLDDAQATGANRNSIDLSGASFTPNEFKGKTCRIVEGLRGPAVQGRVVLSNSPTKIVLEGKFKVDKTVDPKDMPGSPFSSLPYFKIIDQDLVVTKDTLQTKLRDLYLFVCAVCNTRYTVDKP